VKNSDGNEVYRKNLKKIVGAHFDIEVAGKNAYAEAVKKIENTVMREILEMVVKGKSNY
jgi:hypothetical protein